MCIRDRTTEDCLSFSDDTDFCFQMDAMGLFDPSLHFMDDIEDVLGRGMARIDDEAGMFRRYLGIAAGCLLYTSRCV